MRGAFLVLVVVRYAALLRAVNLGPHHRVDQAQLRDLAESLRLREVRTLLASGNLVFTAGRTAPAVLERSIEVALAEQAHLQTSVCVRTAAEWEDLIARNPWPEVARRDPSHLLAVVLKSPPTPTQWAELVAAARGPEVVHPGDRVAYIHYANGVGTSRLTSAVIDRALKTSGTARNWNTVLKLGQWLRNSERPARENRPSRRAGSRPGR